MEECCEYGNEGVWTEGTGELIYPELCDCICHTQDEEDL